MLVKFNNRQPGRPSQLFRKGRFPCASSAKNDNALHGATFKGTKGLLVVADHLASD
jgi:hypothetical protein